MTELCLTLNNISDSQRLLELLPTSNEFLYTEKQVFRSKTLHMCSCGEKMVHNGFDYVRKKPFGKVKVGKQLCKTCGLQRHEDKHIFKKWLNSWHETLTQLATLLRDNDVSWQSVSDMMNFILPCSKTKIKYLFDRDIEQFTYEQDNYLIVNYDEQHPKKGRSQKFRLTLLNYETKNVIADELFDNKDSETIELFLRNNLDVSRKLVIITDCDRTYPAIFKKIWGTKLVHQTCILHLNKLISEDFGKNLSLQDMYNKYLLLNIFYNREKELRYLEKVLKRSKKPYFNWDEERSSFYAFVRKHEQRRRRKKKNLIQRTKAKAKELFDTYLTQIHLFSKCAQKRILMIRKNWKSFTAFYSVRNCPATNNAIENFYSTSLKTHRKKQFRTDEGLQNQMKISAKKRKYGLHKPVQTFVELFTTITLLFT